MLEQIRQLLDQVSQGDTSKLEAIDVAFESLVKMGSDEELNEGIELLENFLFAEGNIGFQDEKKAA